VTGSGRRAVGWRTRQATGRWLDTSCDDAAMPRCRDAANLPGKQETVECVMQGVRYRSCSALWMASLRTSLAAAMCGAPAPAAESGGGAGWARWAGGLSSLQSLP
jgi:hypothetical protein